MTQYHIYDRNDGTIFKEPITRELDWSYENIEIFEMNHGFCTHLWRTARIGNQSSPSMWMQMVEQPAPQIDLPPAKPVGFSLSTGCPQ